MTTEHRLTHIHLGPFAGHDGGRIVFEDTPGDLVAARSTVLYQRYITVRTRQGQAS